MHPRPDLHAAVLRVVARVHRPLATASASPHSLAAAVPHNTPPRRRQALRRYSCAREVRPAARWTAAMLLQLSISSFTWPASAIYGHRTHELPVNTLTPTISHKASTAALCMRHMHHPSPGLRSERTGGEESW